MTEEYGENRNLKIIKIEYLLEIKTGLHIGGAEDKVGIGGIDNRVITERVYLDDNKSIEVPIIPGSSIKGRIRSLLELKYLGNPSKTDIINIVFGRSLSERNQNNNEQNKNETRESITMAAGRAVFRDAFPGDGNEKYNFKDYINNNIRTFQNKEWSEIKGENSIDRKSGRANPRFTERVKPGFKFRGEIVITQLREDKVTIKEMIDILMDGFSLLNESYLGGHGTRGYGKVYIQMLGQPKELNIYS